ncbi:hypothetical protein C5167_006142 [Papaver somniferum]|uniref:Uncharacterized protein n=1 Tax=Papaver somniferum TaxID=3469 RepID=A0A4Y7JGB7_PAPSO|nr:hypothetical protein C5167_006142 [Papaver somniferum]
MSTTISSSIPLRLLRESMVAVRIQSMLQVTPSSLKASLTLDTKDINQRCDLLQNFFFGYSSNKKILSTQGPPRLRSAVFLINFSPSVMLKNSLQQQSSSHVAEFDTFMDAVTLFQMVFVRVTDVMVDGKIAVAAG